MAERSALSWLLLTYKVPSEPTRFRTYLWRQVKALGCLHLQQSAWLLPDTPALEAELRKLVSKVEEFGGEASLLTVPSPDAEWEARVIAGFNAIRDEEYAEIAENGERFEDEVRREARKKKFTFAELEELEADREKLKKWMAKVEERDFFRAPGRTEAENRLSEGARLLEGFTRSVYACEEMGGTD